VVAILVEAVAILEVVVTLVAVEAISAAAVSTLAGAVVISAAVVRISAAVRNSVAAASAEVRISAVAATSVLARSRHRTGVTSGRLIISPAGHISPADPVSGTLALAVISIAITSGTEGFAISTADGGMRTHGGLEVTEVMPTGPMCAHRVGGIARTGTIAAWLITASIEEVRRPSLARGPMCPLISKMSPRSRYAAQGMECS
jgi:hypothetical protein